MKLVLCPRCELNYMNENEKMCSVCRREVKGESEQFGDDLKCAPSAVRIRSFPERNSDASCLRSWRRQLRR